MKYMHAPKPKEIMFEQQRQAQQPQSPYPCGGALRGIYSALKRLKQKVWDEKLRKPSDTKSLQTQKLSIERKVSELKKDEHTEVKQEKKQTMDEFVEIRYSEQQNPYNKVEKAQIYEEMNEYRRKGQEVKTPETCPLCGSKLNNNWNEEKAA